MKYLSLLLAVFLFACNSPLSKKEKGQTENALAQNVIDETARSWQAYKSYAWGHDVLLPLSKSQNDWYEKSLNISPIDAYSTLYVMGLKEQAKEIETFVVDSLNFDKNIYVKIFEVNIRILGGLLSMYELSENPRVLEKARDFADRMLPAFNTGTGIPRYWVNLKTGQSKGDTVNVAEAASYTFEMGMLSYYTKDTRYYQAGKKATLAVYKRRSELGLIGDIIDVESGNWVSKSSHICAGVDSYYEYLFKSYRMFGDPQLGEIWEYSIDKINTYLADTLDGRFWYARADMESGMKNSRVITLYDAFFPAILSLSGDVMRAEKLQASWNWLWNKYGLEPMIYDYEKNNPNWPVYDLNPEIIESAYYVFKITGDSIYYKMNASYWEDVKKYCQTEVAFTSVKDVTSMEQKDYMPTFFIAETLKYFYLTFSNQKDFPFDALMFNTEAHPFFKKHFDKAKSKTYLGY